MATVPELLQLAAPKKSLLADAMQQTRDRHRQDFVDSLQTVAKVNPDQFARATQLERLSGIPADVLHRNSERMEQLLQGNRYAGLYDSYGRTAQALRDGRVAAIAQDDLDNLTRIEHAAQQTRFDQQSWAERNFLGPLKRFWESRAQRSSAGSAIAATADLETFDAIDRAESAGETPFPTLGERERLSHYALDYLRASPEERARTREFLQQGVQSSAEAVARREQALQAMPSDPASLRIQELGGDLGATAEALAEQPQYLPRVILESAPNTLESLAAGAVAGPAGAAVTSFSGEFGAERLDVLREAGVNLSDPKAFLEAIQDDERMDRAEGQAMLKASGVAAVDLLSFGLAGRLLAPSTIGGRALTGTQRELVNLAAQFPVQGGLEAGGEALGQQLATGNVKGGEVLLEGLAGASMSIADVLTFGGGRVIDNLRDSLAKSRVARQARAGLDEMVDAAITGKLRGRDAETFRAVTEQQLRDTGMESVWIPAEKLAQLNQGAQVDLPALLEQIPGLAEQFTEAAARGGSVSITTADYLTYLADYHDLLGDAVRVQVDGMSLEDAAAWQAEQEAELTALAERYRQPVDPEQDARAAMVGELVQAGVRREDAEHYAAVHVATLGTLAGRSGRSLEDLQQQFRLSVRSQAPEPLRQVPVDDARMMIQRLRDGDVPRTADMLGQTLGEYLREAGGLIDDGGELAALDADVGRVGRNRYVRPNGMSLDDAAMQAWERGFFPGHEREEVVPQLIIDAIRDELAGNPRYSAEQESDTLRTQADSLNQLQDYLDQLGVNLATTDDDQVLELLRAPQPEGVRFEQPEEAGPFGPILTQYKGDAQGAIAKLIELQTGEAVGALHHPEIGDIDLVWGLEGTAKSDGYGLAKLVRWHPEVVGNLQEVLSSMRVVKRSQNRVQMESERHQGSVRLQWDGQAKHWLLTAFEKRGSVTSPRTDTADVAGQGDSPARASDEIVDQTLRKFYQGAGQTTAGDSRGFITFTSNGKGPREFQITLGAKRDLSTLLHELGHFYLEVMGDLATAENAPAQLVADMATIRQWVGAEEGKPLTTEQHEQFARGFERYLAEGKAPNPELQGAFARFKRWLIAVYKDLMRLNVDLSDEVRGVFDRLVATDDQIAAARQVVEAMPLFEDAQAAGMTEAEYQTYRDQLALAEEDAKVSVEQSIIREEERRRSKWWREESERVRAEVAEELDTMPVYQAIRALRSGVMPDGSRADIKLQSGEIRERYGNGVLRKLAFMHGKDGMPMDTAASVLGYQSGDELLKAILGAPVRSVAIAMETQARMLERHGAKSTGAAADRAMEAVHNERRAEVLLKELKALAKRGNRRQVTTQQVLKAAAERIMSQRKVRDIQPYEYQRAEAKAGRAAFEAAAKGDLEVAYQAKQQQLLNFYLWREASKAREAVDKIVASLDGLNKRSRREKLGKAGQEYLDQIDAVMEQYEFRTVSLRQLDRRVSMLEWYSAQLAAGTEPYVPEFLLNNARRVNYKDLSLEQLQELHEFVGHVAHLAGLKNKLLANKRLRDFEAAKNELVRAAYANNELKKAPPVDRNTMSMLEQVADKAAHLNSSLLKMEQIVEWLDGGDLEGPWHQVFWQPFVEAQAQKDDLNRQFTTRLMSMVDGYIAQRGKKAMEEQIHIRSLGQPLTRNAILSAALNTGNESNRTKLLNGRKWDENQLAEILGHMTEADWKFVQSLWDLVEELWPSIEQLERDLHGVPPEKVQPLAVSTPFGAFRGGYWPLVYDTSAPEYAGVANNLRDSTGLFEEGYAKATTPKGHTKARVDSFAAPILLDVSIVANHLGMVIHDLTHRRAIRDAAKIISTPEIKQALNQTLGVRVADQFNPWLQGVANDMVLDSRKGIDSWLSLSDRLRANLTVAWMGFSATTGIQQILGFSQSLEYFQQKGGKRYLLKGLREFIAHPLQAAEFVSSLSGEMRNRKENLDQNMRETLRRISGKQNSLAILQRLAFRHIGMIQAFVDIPTWLAGYHQSLDDGAAPDIAVQAGDRAVRLSQMAAGPKDLAAVQRKDGLMRALTITYSYFSLLWNRQVDIARSLKTAKGMEDYLNAFTRSLLLIVIPSVAAPLLTGGEPEDDETWAEWAALKIGTYPLMGIPLLRDFASAWESGWGYRGATPIGSLFETLNRTSGAFAAEEPDAERITLSLIDAAGYGFGLPAAQPKRAVRYLWGVAEGERPDDGVVDFTRGVLFGPPKED